MVQNPKGGGLSSSFGGGGTQQLGGVKKTTDFLDKSTWTLATILLVLILASSLGIDRNGATGESKILQSDDIQLPVPPAATPAVDDATKVIDPATEE